MLLDERRLFLGHARSRGHALVVPQLERWVATKLAEESAVLKERRKGREERALARGAHTEGQRDQPAAAPRGRGRGRGYKRCISDPLRLGGEAGCCGGDAGLW